MKSLFLALGVFLVVAPVVPLQAAETVTYTYDALGRLIKVVHTGTVNNNIETAYTHDNADNRVNVKVTGAPS